MQTPSPQRNLSSVPLRNGPHSLKINRPPRFRVHGDLCEGRVPVLIRTLCPAQSTATRASPASRHMPPPAEPGARWRGRPNLTGTPSRRPLQMEATSVGRETPTSGAQHFHIFCNYRRRDANPEWAVVPSRHLELSGLFQDILETPVPDAPSITIHGNGPGLQLMLLSKNDASHPGIVGASPHPPVLPEPAGSSPAQATCPPRSGVFFFLVSLVTSGSAGPCAFKTSPGDSNSQQGPRDPTPGP